jgi:hypothetical protein
VSSGTDRIVALRERVYNANAREQADLRAAFSEDFAAWCECCAWTYRVKEIDATGRERPVVTPHTPFILWDCQRDAAREIIDGIETGRDVVIRKTRDMGASWLVCAVAVWGWMFKGWQSLLVSRVEDLVDRTGDPDSLFWKVDYLIAGQPSWLLPAAPEKFAKGGEWRQHMMLRHPVSGATVAGMASTEHIGRGGRRTLVLFDEFAALDHADAAWRSAADCTSCRIACSTPIGAGTEYARLVSVARTTGEPRLVELMYWQHPEKGRGAVQRVDIDGSVTGFAGSTFTWSPWLSDQLRRRDRIDLAQNVFAESVGSGASFFASHIVTQHREEFGKTGKRCEVINGKLEPQPQGRWRVWAAPDRVCEYVVFIDPSYGTGSANAAVCIMDANKRETVAEFVDPNLAPYDLALEVAQACRKVWRGRREPLIGWETNGPGAAMQHDFDRAGWRNVYRQRQEGTVAEQRTMRVGWTSTKRTKRSLLGNLARQLAQGECVVRSEECLDEMLEYVVMDDGSIEAGSRRDEASGARESHGDRVIALAGALMLCDEVGQPIPEQPEFGEHSLGSILKHSEVMHG